MSNARVRETKCNNIIGINIPRDYPRECVAVNMWRSSFRSHILELPLIFSKLDDMSFYDFGPVDRVVVVGVE